MPLPAVPELADVATAVLVETASTELEPVVAAVAPPIVLPAVAAQMAAAEPVTAGAVAAPPPEPAPEAPPEAASVANATPDAPPEAAVEQTAPANVNVSVRVDSPGDDGDVEQANTAVEADTAGMPAVAAPQYQPEPPQYQEQIPTADVPETVPADGGWDWSWDWDCGDAIPEFSLPAELGDRSWIWNWNWNCDEPATPSVNSGNEKPPQYQPVVTQYRPININIAIRINSPGNNGAVRQTNVAVVVKPPALPQLRVELPAPLFPPPQSPAASSDAGVPALFVSGGTLMVDPIAQTFATAELLVDPDDCCLLPRPRGVAAAAEEPQSLVLPESPPVARPEITAKARFRAAVAVTLRIAEASAAVARAARTEPAPAPAVRPAPRHSAAPTHERAAALTAAGLAPLNAPDGRLGYVLLLAAGFAFAFAFADARRSVAAEVRAAGEDPDPPPDHPG